MWDIILVTLILIGVALILVTLAAAFVAWKVIRSDERKLAKRIGRLGFGDKLRLGRDIFADPRVPAWARLLAIAIVLYLASPLDIIPDFIPVIGQLDDLLIVILGAGLLLRTVPRHVIEEHVAAYESSRGAETPQALSGSR